MNESVRSIVRFASFELDIRSRVLLRGGARIGLQDQPLQILCVLLERPGELVTREELRQRLWPADTFVDFEHGLNAAVKRLRDALGDSADTPRFVETIPRRGYRFIAAVDGTTAPAAQGSMPWRNRRRRRAILLSVAAVAVTALGYLINRARPASPPPDRALTRLTFAPGFQTDPTWSPDGRFVAYGSDQSGNFDIWVQPVAGGNAVPVTKDPAHDWQPEWSPDGSRIVFRSEREGGGLYVVPALGGHERRIAPFGFLPRWSPDGTLVLFTTTMLSTVAPPRLFTAGFDGSAPREVLGEFLSQFEAHGINNGPPPSAAWHPDGRVSFWGWHHEQGDSLWTVRLDGSLPIKSEMEPAVARRFEELHVVKIAEDIRWSRSGRALYFSGGSSVGSSQVNVWRVDVDPKTLRWIGGPHRLTTSEEGHESLALSADGARLAFTSRTTTRRIVSLPIDHGTRRLNGEARTLAPAESHAFKPDVTRDGDRVVFMVGRLAGKGGFEIRTRSLADDRETLVVSWGPPSPEGRIDPRWSPDGTRLAYMYWGSSDTGGGTRAIIADARTGSEQPITSFLPVAHPFDWSGDGQSLLASLKRTAADPVGVWTIPLAAAPEAEKDARLITSDAHYELWQPRFSPSNRWVAFNAVPQPDQSQSTVYVVPASGGSWTQVTEGRYWDDKPRWSPDGRAIYFISSRDGVFNVWAVPFDAERGRVEGKPVRVTAFNGPRQLMLPNVIVGDIAVSKDRLFVCLEEASGSIWTLDNVDR